MMNEVTKLKYLGGYRLHATFSDGTAGEHDFFARGRRGRSDGWIGWSAKASKATI
jgi:hypothetical protein